VGTGRVRGSGFRPPSALMAPSSFSTVETHFPKTGRLDVQSTTHTCSEKFCSRHDEEWMWHFTTVFVYECLLVYVCY